MQKYLLTTLIALSFCGVAIAQLPVSQAPQKKKIVMEEYNGIHCDFCPEGHLTTNIIEADHPGNAMIINVHTGSFANPGAGDPDFRTPFGSALAAQTGLTGYPSATVNRHIFSGGSTAMNRGAWRNAANSIRTQDAYVNVALEADINAQTREMTVNVELYYTDDAPVSENYINVVLTQSNIKGFQGNLMDNPAQVDEDGNYIHNHALRHMITGQWGDLVNTVSFGSLVSRTYTYTLPLDYNDLDVDFGDLEVVAFVAESHQEVISGNYFHPTVSNFSDDLNASLEEVKVPEIECEGDVAPKVKVRNNGNDVITSVEFEYAANDGPSASYTWNSGDILPGHAEMIELPGIGFVLGSVNEAEVTISKVNSVTDETTTDNQGVQTFEKLVNHYADRVTLRLWTDQYASETSWRFVDATSGTELYSSPGYNDLSNAGTTLNTYSFNVNDGRCYYFEINDYYGDGLCSGYGNGHYELVDGGTVILEGCDFGTFESIFFTTNPAGFTLNSQSVSETHPTSEGDPTVHNVLTPNSVPMTLRWYLVDLDVPAGWTEEVAVCDDVECHVSTLTTYEYTVDEVEGTVLDVHFINNNLEGEGYAQLLVYDVNDSAATAILVDFYVIITNATAVIDHNTELVDVFPNPATHILYIKGLGDVDAERIEIYNTLGEVVRNVPFSQTGEEAIEVASLEDGLYLIRMYDRQRQVWLAQSFIKH